jgi:hypothetical protein
MKTLKCDEVYMIGYQAQVDTNRDEYPGADCSLRVFVPRRVQLRITNRLLLVWLYAFYSVLQAISIVKLETVIR